MRIVPIFEGLLYSFQPESEDVSEFQKFFEFLQDQEQLFNFFKENKADLKRPYSVSSALQQIRGDFTRMFRELQRKASENDLTTLFRHIQSSNIKGELYSREKYRYQRSWLRMYAIRLEGDIFIVSGGPFS